MEQISRLTSSTPTISSKESKKSRLMSVDALRGFDMFWIIGGEKLFLPLYLLTGWSIWNLGHQHMLHSEWHGFTLYDLIFPLFIFLSGVSVGLANLNMNHLDWPKRKSIYKKSIIRLGLLILLGTLYNHGWGTGIPADLNEIRYASVLARIGFAWFIAAMIVWHTSIRFQLVFTVSLLLIYWLLQMGIQSPLGGKGIEHGALTWNAWFDQTFLPGIHYQNMPADPEGILSTLPAVINAMCGVWAGKLTKFSKASLNTILILFAGGMTLFLTGWLWNLTYPINKTLWTGSFIFVTVGLSAIFLAIFYGLIDVLQQRLAKKAGRVFAVIGVNSILIYLLSSLFNWSYLVNSLFGGLISSFNQYSVPLGTFISIVFLLLIQWMLLAWLNRKKIWLKV